MTPFGKMSPFGFMRGWENPFLGPFWRAGKKRRVAPMLQFATNEPDGRLKLLFNRAITGNTGVSVTASGGAVTLSNPTPGVDTRVLYFDQSRVPGPDEDVVVDIASSDIASGGAVILDVADVPVWSYFLLADGKALLNPASNPTVRSIANGAAIADAATVWDTGEVPTAADRVLVTHAVTNAGTLEVGGLLVWTGGTMAFDETVNTELIYDTIVIAGTGAWQQGTSVARIAADKTSIITRRDTALPHQQLDPFQMHGGWIACEDAVVDIYGAVITTDASDMVLAVEPLTGHTTLTLAAAPTGWLDGYRVVIPDTRPVIFGEGEQLEVRTIVGIVGAVITLDAPLAFDHLGGRNAAGTVDVWPQILVIENNVIWRSANANGVRGHSMVSGACTVNASFPYLKNMGRTTNQSPANPTPSPQTITDDSVVTNGITTYYGTNQKGRYPWHEHHHYGPENIPNTGFQSHLTGMSIEDGLKWPIAFHRTHFVETRGIRIYGANHAGIAFESDNESYNVIDNCSIIGVTNDGTFTIADGMWGLAPAYNTITNNYIATVMQGFADNIHTYQGHCIHLLDGQQRGGQRETGNDPDRYPLKRGVDIDAVGAVEDTDYEMILPFATEFTACTGNKGQGSTKFFSKDHFGSLSATITISGNSSSGMGKEHFFDYGQVGHVVCTNSTVRRWGEHGYSVNTMNEGSTHVINNPDIQQYDEAAGIGDQTPGFSWLGGADQSSRLRINGGTIAAHYPIAAYFATLNQNPGPPTATSPQRVQTFNGVTLTPLFGSTTEIDMRWGDQGTPRDPCAWEQVFVFDYDGTGVAYQLFWDEQGADEPCEVGTGYGATVPGNTNDEEFALSGRASGGEVMPAGASTEAWLSGGKAIALLSGVVDADGVTVTLTASAAITTDGTGWSVTGSTTGLVALAYVSGSGTTTLVFTAADTLVTGETVAGAYAAATGNASTTAAGVVLPDVAFGVTNNSEQVGSLLTGLVSYWELEEASGTRADSHGSNDLTENGTVGSATGKIGDAADLGGSGEYLSVLNDADFQEGTGDPFTVAGWVFLNGSTASFPGIFARTPTDWSCFFNGNDTELIFRRNGFDDVMATISAATGRWIFVVVGYDGTNTHIQVDNGTVVNSGAENFTHGPPADTPVYIGTRSDSGGDLIGLMDEVGYWHRWLSSGERAELYNAGAGLAYPFS